MALESVGVHGEVPGAAVTLKAPSAPSLPEVNPLRVSTLKPRGGMISGMRSLMAFTTPPMACDP
jgi:hypothetical protein